MQIRRLLVLGLVLTLVPASGRALPIEEPGEAELLVEGHTVFMTIDAVQYEADEADARAAARGSERVGPEREALDVGVRYIRFPGVAWFNDQYLVDPTVRDVETLGPTTMRSEYAAAISVLVRADDGERVREPCGGALLAWQQEGWDPRWFDFTDPGTYLSDLTYIESYRMMDPNAHAWVVDKYLVYEWYPLWVANLHGGETFVPDDPNAGLGAVTDDCRALVDITDPVGALSQDALCAFATYDPNIDFGQLPTMTDDPCTGYQEPSRSGHCYGGQLLSPAGGSDRCDDEPRRRHSGLLYFDWADLAPIGFADHCGWDYPGQCSGTLFDTNGCEAGTEWDCEGGWEALEGNSHSFHPDSPPHMVDGRCPVPSWNPANHGAQLNATGEGPPSCSYWHEVAPIDVYYSGASRPLAPPARLYAVDDLSGASAPFVDVHSMFGFA